MEILSGAIGYKELHAAIRAAHNSLDQRRALSLVLIMACEEFTMYQLRLLASDVNVPPPYRWALADLLVDETPHGMAVTRNEGRDLSCLRTRGITVSGTLTNLEVLGTTPEGRVLARGRFRHIEGGTSTGFGAPVGYYQGAWRVTRQAIPEFYGRYAADLDALRWSRV